MMMVGEVMMILGVMIKVINDIVMMIEQQAIMNLIIVRDQYVRNAILHDDVSVTDEQGADQGVEIGPRAMANTYIYIDICMHASV